MKVSILVLGLLLGIVPTWAQERPGIGVDARGGAVIDPTKNVLDLVAAAIARQDDLRAASKELFDAKLASEEKLSELRYIHSVEVAKALSDQLNAEARLRAEYDARLRDAESRRIDAIRLVDVNAVAEDRRRTGEQAVALATQVSQSADTVRALVASTKTSTDLSTNQITEALSRRITTLEQAGYQQAGQQKFQDPAFTALVAKVESLANSRTDLAGVSTGHTDVTGYVIVAVGMLIAAFAAFAAFRPKSDPVMAELLAEIRRQRTQGSVA
jgi:hypothetical protein